MCFLSLSSARNVIELNSGDYEGPVSSDIGVEYDGILKYQFLVDDWVYVTVDIKDTSGINISSNDSAEGFASKIDERTNILSEISNSVFETLSEDEFILEGFMVSGRGFSGNITEEGFEKLLSDTRVRKIYAKKNFTISSGLLGNSSLICYASALLLLIFVLIILLIKSRREKISKRK